MACLAVRKFERDGKTQYYDPVSMIVPENIKAHTFWLRLSHFGHLIGACVCWAQTEAQVLATQTVNEVALLQLRIQQVNCLRCFLGYKGVKVIPSNEVLQSHIARAEREDNRDFFEALFRIRQAVFSIAALKRTPDAQVFCSPDLALIARQLEAQNAASDPSRKMISVLCVRAC